MRKTTRRVVVGAVTGLTLLATACGNQSTTGGASASGNSTAGAVKGGTLNMLGSGDVDYMDPNLTYYSIGYLGARMWSRQLFSYPATSGQTMTAQPDMAQDIPTSSNGGISSDGLTYTIKLRSGIKWNTSPARAVTAADVVRGLKRTCNPAQPFGGLPDFESLIVGMQSYCDGFAKVSQTASAISGYLEAHQISGFTAKDDQTLQIKLTHPASYFVDMMTLPAFSAAPKEWDAYVPGSAQLAQHTLSDGPYQVQSYTPTKNITYTRNAAWDGSTDPIRKAYVDKIVVNETVSQDSTQQQLQTNSDSADMEWDNFPPPSQLPQLIAKKDPDLNLGPTSASNPYIVFNTASPNNSKALQNVQVRQAIADAFNRSDFLQVLGGQTVNPPLTHVLPSSIKGGETNFDLYPNDTTKAQSLLKSAGASKLTLKVLYRNSSSGSTKVFQTIQQDLSKIGITVVGVPSPNSDFYTKYLEVPTVAQRGVWDLAVAGWSPDWYGDAALSYFYPLFDGKSSFPPSGSNFGLYNDAKTNTLIQQAAQAKTTDESSKLWAQADKQVMTDVAIYPLTSQQQANYHASQVQNAVYIPAIQNFDPTNVWLTTGHQGG